MPCRPSLLPCSPWPPNAGLLTLGAIVALAVLGATFDPAGYTARKSLIPDVAHAGRFYVDRINGVHEGVFAAGWVIGPALAAIGISTIGVISTFWVTAAAFVLAIVAVGGINVTEAIGESRHEAGEEHEPFWASISRGARIRGATRPLRVLTLAIGVLAMVYMPTESVLMPVYFESTGQPTAYGLTLTFLAAGGMVGSFSYGWLSARLSKHHIVVLVMVAVTVAIIPMAFLPPLPVFVVAGFLLGRRLGADESTAQLAGPDPGARARAGSGVRRADGRCSTPPLPSVSYWPAWPSRRGASSSSTPSSACCWWRCRCSSPPCPHYAASTSSTADVAGGTNSAN